MPSKSQRDREDEQRRVKLERMQEQVDRGSLVIRKMTDEERARYAPRPRPRDERRTSRARDKPRGAATPPARPPAR